MKSSFYFVKLFYESKFLFVLVLLFISFSLAANFIFKTEQTPLFVWNLYSLKIPQQKIYSFLEIRYNNNDVLSFQHTWNEPQKLFFTNTMDYFIAIKRNNDTDPLKNYIATWNSGHPFFKKMLPGLKFYNDTTELENFPQWYKRYLEQLIKKPVYKIDIYEIKIAYRQNGELKKLSSSLIYKLL